MDISERIIGFNQKHKAASHVAFWLLVLLLQYNAAAHYNPDTTPFWDIMLAVGTTQIAQMAAAYFLTYFVVSRYIYKQKYLPALAWFALSVYVICVLSRVEVVHVEEPYYGVKKPNPQETYWELFTDLPKLMYVYFFRIYSVAFVFMLTKLLKDQLLVQRRTLALEKQKAETELKLLKTQLNPHFLFNTLNNIYSLALLNSPVTAGAIGRLSEILDYILYHCDNTYVPVSGEITLLNNYIGLEKLRYDDRLTVNFSVNAEPQALIAPLILLAIVENAFKHGAGNDTGKPNIDIVLRADADRFEFTVSNTYQLKALKSTGNIGLPNLKQQLELIYPRKHELIITETASMFIVNLTLLPA